MEPSRWMTMQCGLDLHANCPGERRTGDPCECACHQGQGPAAHT